jgi:Fic family protein
VAAVGHEAADTAKRIVQFRTDAQQLAVTMGKSELGLIDHLFKHPIMDARTAEKLLDVTYATANNALSRLEGAGLIRTHFINRHEMRSSQKGRWQGVRRVAWRATRKERNAASALSGRNP